MEAKNEAVGALSCLAQNDTQVQLAIATGLVALLGLSNADAGEKIREVTTQFAEATDIHEAINVACEDIREEVGEGGEGGTEGRLSKAPKSSRKSLKKKKSTRSLTGEKAALKGSGKITPKGEGGDGGKGAEGEGGAEEVTATGGNDTQEAGGESSPSSKSPVVC